MNKNVLKFTHVFSNYSILHRTLYSSIMYLTWETGCVCAREGSVVQTRARVTTVPLSKCLSCRVMFSFMLTI